MQIKHTSALGAQVGKYIVKRDDTSKIRLSKEFIEHDINRLNSELGTHNKVDDHNIKELVKYLSKLKKCINKSDSTIELIWNTGSDGLPKTYPLSFIHEEIYNVDIINYIEISTSESLISIDLKELADFISYEYIFRELGESNSSIEGLLSKCSLVSANNAEILRDKFRGEVTSIYNLSQQLLINDSMWASKDEGIIVDYFSTKEIEYSKTSYSEVIKYSCRYAVALIADKLIKKSRALGLKCNAIEISETHLTLLIDTEVNTDAGKKVVYNVANSTSDGTPNSIDFKKDIMEDIDIQVFGRLFRIKYDISIY